MHNKLVLVRHGQSESNAKNLFSGWHDSPLTTLGEDEAIQTGIELANIEFSYVFSSTLVRAYDTAQIILQQNNFQSPEITQHDELKQRDYGDLTGMNKHDIAQLYGEEIVKIWRKDFTTIPLNGESLEQTYNRIVPFYKEEILPKIKEGNVLVSAHGGSLRVLIKHIEKIAVCHVNKIEIKTGEPVIYEQDELI